MKHAILKIVFLVWVGLWLIFFARELFVKDNLRDYRALAGRDLDGKRAYVTGERLHAFLNFCKERLPKGATYRLDGIEDGSIEKRRAVYSLYPMLESPDPDYILVYGAMSAGHAGYSESASSEHGRILKKRGTAR